MARVVAISGQENIRESSKRGRRPLKAVEVIVEDIEPPELPERYTLDGETYLMGPTGKQYYNAMCSSPLSESFDYGDWRNVLLIAKMGDALDQGHPVRIMTQYLRLLQQYGGTPSARANMNIVYRTERQVEEDALVMKMERAVPKRPAAPVFRFDQASIIGSEDEEEDCPKCEQPWRDCDCEEDGSLLG